MQNPNEVDPARPPPASRLQLAVVAAFIAGYALLSFYADAHPDGRGLATFLTIGPLALIGAFFVWRWARPVQAAVIIILAGGMLVRHWPFLEQNYEWADLAQQCGAYLLVAAGFARSLSGGRTPLCTQLSDKLHGPLAAAEIAYTRRATWVWAVFYGLLAAAIVVVYFRCPQRVWSLFVNFGTFGLIGLLFVADHALRRRLLPHRPNGGMLAALRQSLTGSR
jgi:uncharacterized membrane protein